MKRLLPVLFVLQIILMGCAKKAHVPCEWSGSASPRKLDLTNWLDRQRLARDAHAAEDAAIRYGDSLAHDRFEDARFRNDCIEVIFPKVAEVNGVTVGEVRQSLDIRPLGFDLVVELSFVILYYWFIAGRVTWRIRGLYPERLAAALPIILLTSVVISALALPLGEVWTGALETIRIGNGHISYRLSRIPWQDHRLGTFIGGIILFWLLTALEYRFKWSGETLVRLNLLSVSSQE